MFQDTRIAARQLVQRPGWAIAIIVVLAVGIGANTAMFSGFEAWVLRPLDFDEPERLVSLRETQPQLGREILVTSPGNFGDWVAQQQSFESLGAYDETEYNWNDEHEPARLVATRVTWTLFPTLRKEPVLGRNFTAADDNPGRPAKVMLIAHGLWQERFDADPAILGRTARLDGELHEIIGVMEPGFAFPAWSEVWTPLGLDVHSGSRGGRWLSVVARLADGVDIEAARSDVEAIGERLARLHPDLLTAELSFRGSDSEPATFAERVASALDAQPGVTSAGVTSHLPASQGYRVWGLVARDRTHDVGEDVDATVHATLGDYFETLAIPIVVGRDFTDLEKREGADVAIVSTELARELWGDEDPLGRQLKVASREDDPWRTVVGVAGSLDIGRDMVSWGEIPGVQLYVPFGADPTTSLEVVVYGTAPETELASAIRDAFRTTAPGVPFSEVLTMEDAIFRVRWVSSYFSRQLAVYALLALLIAAVGLYGLTADSVSRRTRELAIRAALGADRSRLMRIVVIEAMKLGALGVAMGLVLSFGVTRFAARMLVGVDARDPIVFTSVGALLLIVVVVAASLPARRASSLDPNRALRAE